jgi:ubiquinol oxidase
MLLPQYAYYLMELIEQHAYDTYDLYLNTHADFLKTQPPPAIAVNYYRDGDLYMFEEFQTSPRSEFRRPCINNLYDVFVNIRDDECEHVKTMIACQQPETRAKFKSPHSSDGLTITHPL